MTIFAYEMKIEVFYDGLSVRTLELNGYYQLPPISGSTAVLAFNLTNCGSWGGLLGATTDGSLLTSNSTWKCVDTSTVSASSLSGWQYDNYIDGAWPLAIPSGQNIQFAAPKGFCQIPLINSDAWWIWTSPLPSSNKSTVLCRVDVPPVCPQTSNSGS
jgi:hypothetical protein